MPMEQIKVKESASYVLNAEAEGNGGRGIGEAVAKEQLQQSVFSKKENGRDQTTQEVQGLTSDERENTNFSAAWLSSLTEPHEDEDGVPFTEEFDPEETEYDVDVETVLKKQNTHDLICPKCNSCITRRVILRRKGRWRIPKIPTVTIRAGADQSPAEEVPAAETGAPAVDTAGHGCPEVFRCLSCFTCFIRRENVPQAQAEECPCFPFFPWKTPPPAPEEDETDSPPQTVRIDVPEEPGEESPGAGVTATTDGAAASQTTPSDNTQADENPPRAAETDTGDQPLLGERRATEVRETRDFDVLKSIVYGGLAESIASLGVVSSAAGGGAATLNTFALALANLVGGLLVLVNNLRDLKNEHSGSGQAQADSEEEDRYYQELGRRGRFSLHAMLAIISYLVFGLVAPITYGFSFRISDDRNYKLAAVAAACLPCILLLALGKAYVLSKSYVETGLYYLSMGVTASGISFLVGELVDFLLERLGLFTASDSGGNLRVVSPARSGWASY